MRSPVGAGCPITACYGVLARALNKQALATIGDRIQALKELGAGPVHTLMFLVYEEMTRTHSIHVYYALEGTAVGHLTPTLWTRPQCVEGNRAALSKLL